MSKFIDTKANSAGAAVMNILSSPWVRKPAYFVASVATVTMGFGVVVLRAFLSGEEDGDIGNVGTEEEKLKPSPLAVGMNLEANRAHPGQFDFFNNELDRQYRQKRDNGSYLI